MGEIGARGRAGMSVSPDWFAEAACKGKTAQMFPADRNDNYKPGRIKLTEQEEAGKAICHSCPVMMKCRDFAMEHWFLSGIWGGLLDHERRSLRRRKYYP